jgi:LruC domain-containing protein
MKNTKIIILLLIVTTIFGSCNKENIVVPGSVIESVNDLSVPTDFDWKTTQTLNISVVLPNNGVIQPLIITNISGTKRYFRGYPDDESRTVNTIITIPAYIKELRLIYSGTNGPNMVLVSNGSLSYDFNTTTKSANNSDVSQINLGSIANFALYSTSGAVSNTGASNITGDIGTNFGAITGFGPPSVINGSIQNANSVTTQAALDLMDVIAQIDATVTTNSGHAPAFGNDETLTPGVYSIAGAGSIAGTLTLDAQGNTDAQFIFKFGLAFTTGAGTTVVLINGASSENVFWVARGAVAMAASTTISGNLIGNPGAVSMGAGGELNGRMLSNVGAVSLLNCMTFIPDQNYPNIELSSLCADPDVIFTISNTGDDMTNQSVYTLFKNDVQIISDSYLLNLNQSIEITSAGTTDDDFRLVVETSGQGDLEETIQGCGDNPSEQYSGTLAYEDLWPGKGDYDFNDLVVDYEFDIVKNSQEVVQSMTVTCVIKAFGASLHNGFGFTLPTVNPGDVVSVSGYDVINDNVFSIASNGLENGQSKATIIVFDDVYRVMPNIMGGVGVNTQLAYAYTEPVTVVVNIVLANNAITYSELNIGTFNPFIIVGTTVNGVPGSRGKEVHLPNYEPSDLFDTDYFGQSSDNSTPAEGRYFVTANNLPSAINIAEEFDWVIEFQDITGAFNMFAEWAQGNGTVYADWYQNKTGYRNNSLIYPTQVVE